MQNVERKRPVPPHHGGKIVRNYYRFRQLIMYRVFNLTHIECFHIQKYEILNGNVS